MPRYVDHAERRKAIVHAAWTLIAGEGYDAVTIRRLAEELGGATGRITNYFSGKDDILIAVLEELTASHQSGLARLSSALDEAGGDVDLIAAALVESLPLDDERVRDWKIWLAFWTRASISSPVARQHHEVYAAWRTRLGEALEAAAPADLAVLDVDQAAEQLLAFIDGLGVHLLIEPSRADRQVLRAMTHRQVLSSVEQGVGEGQTGTGGAGAAAVTASLS